MAKVEGFSIRNYGVLKDITLGKLWNTQKNRPLTPLTVVIGKNGSGKSTLFDVFGFLADCLKLGVEEACEARGRGGFDRIRSQECSDPIEFHIYYRQSASFLKFWLMNFVHMQPEREMRRKYSLRLISLIS